MPKAWVGSFERSSNQNPSQHIKTLKQATLVSSYTPAMPHFTRRSFAALAARSACASLALSKLSFAQQVSLFNGHNLDGWLQIENSATTLSSDAITDQPAFIARLTHAGDPLSSWLLQQLDEPTRTQLATYASSSPDAKATVSALVKQLNQLLAGPSLYTSSRFTGIALRPETQKLLNQNPTGQQLARLNRLLLEDAYPELKKSSTAGWTVKDGAMASTGSGRGVIYTAKDYSRYRIMFTMRHVSGKPDHQACVLVFCTRPQPNEKPLDALGGIQFQVPNGGHWDYRPGHNDAGTAFTTINKPGFDIHSWSRVELLVDAEKGTARMAVAQPLGSKAVEVLAFSDPTAGKSGPFALQMHNAGLFDEYKDIVIEPNPTSDRFTITG
jgi:hypothetical protein